MCRMLCEHRQTLAIARGDSMANPQQNDSSGSDSNETEGVRSLTQPSTGVPESHLQQSVDSNDTAFDLSTLRYRPAQRPPTAVLWVMDDDQQSGERYRMRTSSLIIGRTEGDVRIPHDAQISVRHAELTRHLEDGRYAWRLRDLNSTNGAFVKVAKARLSHGWEFRVGYTQFRFDSGVRSEDDSDSNGQPSAATAGQPALIKLNSNGQHQRYPLAADEQFIGRDASRCWLPLTDDATVSPEHARVYRDERGRWHVADVNTLNGVWLRINELRLASGGEFELGEQRFRIVFS